MIEQVRVVCLMDLKLLNDKRLYMARVGLSWPSVILYFTDPGLRFIDLYYIRLSYQ